MTSSPPEEGRGERNVDFSLYLITDRHQTGGRPLTSVVREALEGGVRAVQLREKDLSGRALFALASEMRRITRDHDAYLFINERIDIALAVDADGVHIGTDSLPVSEARRLLGRQRLIGYSAHAVEEAGQAEADGADFITFGPVYHTPSKSAYGAPLGLEKLAEAVCALSIPVFALGGVKKTSIAETAAAGTARIALISAIIAAHDPKAEAASLLQMIKQHARNP